jgi:hypothetical protein
MREVIAGAFRMTDDAWRRHANPWSVYTRFAAIPPLILAIWSRAWIGWWCLVPLAMVAIWLWLNPHVFRPVTRPVAWASKGVFGEEIWARRRDAVPARHRTAFRLIAIPGLVGIASVMWGLVALAVWPTVFGATLVRVSGRGSPSRSPVSAPGDCSWWAATTTRPPRTCTRARPLSGSC